MDRDTLDRLTRAFLGCNDLDDDEVEEALRGFGYEGKVILDTPTEKEQG